MRFACQNILEIDPKKVKNSSFDTFVYFFDNLVPIFGQLSANFCSIHERLR